uniref:FERM domain containing 3 n=1 Tax=Amphilophus citrinellus TaxID=61819 RepID=A0A3Q0R4P3_AMPCI
LAKNLICQVKITTRRSLHLRIANHTRRDVYVRLPLRVSMETTNLRPQTPKDEHELEEDDEASGTLIISELTYSPCASMLPTPVDDSQGGVDLLFSSPVQSPARLLRELHADPDIQAQLEAERDLRLLSSNDRVNACVLSVARFVAVVMGVLLVTVPTLLILLESDIDTLLSIFLQSYNA